MIHRLFTITSALSMLLCVATAALWIAGIGHDLYVDFETRSSQLSLHSVNGHLALGHFKPYYRTMALGRFNIVYFSIPASSETDIEWAISDDSNGVKSKAGGFGFYFTTEATVGDVQRWVVVPTWTAALLLCVLPAMSVLRVTRNRGRRLFSQCVTCSYNLTGNASGVCPECGTAVRQQSGNTE